MGRFEGGTSVTLCVLGQNPFGGALEKLAQTPIDGRAVQVRKLASAGEAGECDFVFVAASGVPRAICGHRPVLPLMLEALGVPDRPMLTAAVLVAHLSPEGETICVEWHKPRV